MSDDLSLRAALENTIVEWCSANGGGFPIGFVCALDYINEVGENELVIAEPNEQPTHRALGLAAYLDSWFRDDAQRVWANLGCEDEE